MTDDCVQIRMDDLMLPSDSVSTFNTFGSKLPHSLHSIWLVILVDLLVAVFCWRCLRRQRHLNKPTSPEQIEFLPTCTQKAPEKVFSVPFEFDNFRLLKIIIPFDNEK